MGKPKLPLKYFAHLIDLGGLDERRTAIYEECVGRAMGQGAKLTDDETVIYEDYESSLLSKFPDYHPGLEFIREGRPRRQRPAMHLFKPAHPTTCDLKEEICAEVKQQTVKGLKKLYEQLRSGSQSERELVYKDTTRDLGRWSAVIAAAPLYSKYPCIAAALQEIRMFLNSYSPLSGEVTTINAPTPKTEPVVGFSYQYAEAGAKPEQIRSMTLRCLSDFYHVLKDELKLIAPETTLEDFRTVFLGKVVSVPIRWLGNNSQLRHLIMAVEPKLSSPGAGSIRVSKKWDIAAACFVNRKGEAFKSAQLMSTGTGGEGVRMEVDIERAAKKIR